MKVFVCVGSSCHLKGSYHVLEAFQQAIAEHQLEDQVTLSAAFCLGYCRDGVSIKVNEDIVTGVTLDTFDGIFQERILRKLGQS